MLFGILGIIAAIAGIITVVKVRRATMSVYSKIKSGIVGGYKATKDTTISTSKVIKDSTLEIWNSDEVIEARVQMKKDFSKASENIGIKKDKAVTQSKIVAKKGGLGLAKLLVKSGGLLASGCEKITAESTKKETVTD